MSYGSKVCPTCQGELKVYVDGDGSASGWCPHCRSTWSFGRPVHKPRISDEGAFYEVVVTEYIDEYQGIENGMKHYHEKMVRWEESLAMYTSLEGARKRCEEVRKDAESRSTETDRVQIVANIKRWNHDRTDWEYWRPEWAEQEATA